ncbi:ATP-dependent RNA helicase DHX36 isoform X1 [Tripterygium wilfordii]|uniref:RNA helicase n=1 Tax=Tripterygium wilfordii TaxID=458696 RepID=A0A7J7DZQ3_TRIWF|nr:DExH-box ATP-dependent RNA helicase DExH5, mitochondrial-like [Tripterygium wilfordii]KAF5751882.1 ATP-dependent RNA helicase DHX36 isoform X1 [Tripterygium wilfordii]
MLPSLLFPSLPPPQAPSPTAFRLTTYPETLKPSLFSCRLLSMKDRSPSYGSVYVPPHHRLRSFVTAPNYSSHANPSPESKEGAALKPGETLPDWQSQQQKQQQLKQQHQPQQWSNYSRDTSILRDGASEDGSDWEFDSTLPPGVSPSVNTEEWKQKLDILLRDKDKHELVSREKKDRRHFDQIAALASRMGLYSHLYAKVVVFSKVPLPNYRFDLDDKRPQREVSLHASLLRRVDAYLSEHISQKSSTNKTFPDISFTRSSSMGSFANDDWLFEQPELPVSSNAVKEKKFWRRSLQLRNQQQTWQESPEGRKMLEFRASLPAFKEKGAILEAISRDQVVIISGVTGCGKTTQIPQFILESEIESVRGAVCSIICTQPRRISAMSVSERVSSERGEKLGESVGYKVRLEGMKGRDTHLLFCTTGILLRRLLVDRNLKGVTHVVVDEIHERGMNEDFLLIVLKDLLPRRPDLRLILMSATLDAEIFSSYFGGALVINIPGFAYPVRTHFLEDILEMTTYRLTSSNQIDDYGQEKMWKINKQTVRKRKSQIASVVEDALRAADLKEYSLQTQESLSFWNPDCIGFNLIEHILCYICEKERPGAVLVFMTGWDDISSLKEKLQSHPILGDPSQVLLLACHGSMASSEQRLIFEEPEVGVRKIVLATNIAETSITINDVVFVLDCGKAKETSYDALNNTPCLLPSWISKASALQRRGRSGRVQAGECYHLYPRCVYDAFAEYQLPEILRTPLQSLCLQIKSLKLGSISEFLSRALQSPELLAVQNAIEYLKVIGALDNDENLTVLGRYLTMLPVEPKLGKMLVLGSILDCLDPILTVVAGLSARDPFLTPFDKKDLAEAAKSQFSHDYSDHFALIRAYEGWKEAEGDLNGFDFCWKNFLSAQSMRAIDSLRKEFFSLLKDTGLIDSNATICNAWSHDDHMIRAIICYGLYPGICSVMNNEKSFLLKTMEDGQVLLYSNSVNARETRIPYPWLVFNEKIKVKSVFLRDSTAVSDSVLLLFGGSISSGDIDGHLKMLGGHLEFFMQPAVATMYRSLRRELDELIQNKLLNPRMDIHGHHEILSAVRLLVSEDQCDGRFVFGRQVLNSPKTYVMETQPTLVSRSESGPGGDNSKSQLQTLLTRAGYAAPSYKTKQLKNNQFRAIVEFNGMQIMGNPCSTKKNAEKDAAAEALHWLMGGMQTGDDEYINHMSVLLKKSKNNHN